MLTDAIKGFLIVALTCAASPAAAWGHNGHEVVAAIARSYLTVQVRAKVDAILSTDPDALTGSDMMSRATWADAWRGAGHKETAEWHFSDIELDHPDLAQACFGFPKPSGAASAGPAKDCVVDKVDQFVAELAAPSTTPAERVLALKYLLHFVGDIHQPLHSSDNHDRGGNCVQIALGSSRTVNLHSYWDSVVVDQLGSDPQQIADTLRLRIDPATKAKWERGNAAAWAMESFLVAKAVTYRLGSTPGCDRDAAPISLPAGYAEAAKSAAAVQLERAGVRLADLLNKSLAHVKLAASPDPTARPLARPREPSVARH